jgi:hypothetical protein
VRGDPSEPARFWLMKRTPVGPPITIWRRRMRRRKKRTCHQSCYMLHSYAVYLIAHKICGSTDDDLEEEEAG